MSSPSRVSTTNTYVNQTTLPVQISLLAGVPSYYAVLLNDTNQADANWLPYSGHKPHRESRLSGRDLQRVGWPARSARQCDPELAEPDGVPRHHTADAGAHEPAGLQRLPALH